MYIKLKTHTIQKRYIIIVFYKYFKIIYLLLVNTIPTKQEELESLIKENY